MTEQFSRKRKPCRSWCKFPRNKTPKLPKLPTLDSCLLRLKRWTMVTLSDLQTKRSTEGRDFFLKNRFLGKSVAQHFEDCHRSPKNFPGSLSKLGTTSLFYPRYCKAYVGERRGRAPGLREVGRGRILKLLASPVPSSACTSCESAVRGLDRRTTPSPSTKSLAGDAAAVVPPETGAGGGAREGVAGTWELESICQSRKQTRELSP